MKAFFNNRILVTTNDITKSEMQAIVNAANTSLLGGGGVDGAIHRTGGKIILEQCQEIRKKIHLGGLPTGKAVITTGGNLQAEYVIHTVGPIYEKNRGKDDELLISCYEQSLKLAIKNKIHSISFPAISTGVYGFPKERAAKLIGHFLKEYIYQNNLPETIELCFFISKDTKIFLDNCGW